LVNFTGITGMEENKRYWNTVSTTITAREGVHKFPILYCIVLLQYYCYWF